jgi:hypothetical protein
MNAAMGSQRGWIKYASMAAACLLVGWLLSIEVYFNVRAEMKVAVDFWDVAVPQFGRAVMWAALVPLVLALRRKMPLARGGWIGGLGFHLGMSFVVMATFYLGRMFGYTFLWEKTLGNFWAAALGGFYGRNLIDMAFYWAVLAFGYGLEIHRRYKSEELKAAQLEARLIETELKTLREQLRPHFLFNTLNTIAVMVRENRNDAAVHLIARLSSLLRISLETHAPETTLRQEVDFLERYVDIQKARFSDRLTVGMTIDPEALDARIPNLLLQPLVENAILHGIASKSGPGRVDILGRVADGRLHLEVRDDGPGLDEGRRRAREGVGLANTRERIQKIYGAAGHLALHSEPGRGVTVHIVLPCRT